MAFDLRPTEDVLPWLGNANMTFDLRPTEDVLPRSGNANMAFDLQPTKDVLPRPGNANMTFDLRPTEDVLLWPGNVNMAFDLRPTEDVLPWPVMSLSPRFTITSSEFDMENAFSTMNVHNYTSASSATSGSTSFNSSEDSRDGMIPPTFSLFYNNSYLKNVQAFYAKESPIPPPDPITPPAILTPSPILPPLLLFNPRYFLMPPKRMSTSEAPDLTHATIEELVAHSIVVILEAQDAMMASTNNPNSKPRKTPVARKCTYVKFTSYQPFYFNGTEGAVGLIHWFKRTESIFSRSKCAEKNKVRFVVNTLTKEALFWWNSFTQSIGIEETYKITWSEFKRLLIEKYCPQTEIKKMEEAITMTQKLIKHVTRPDANMAYDLRPMEDVLL
ncbi:hypothetical protein Tco_0581129 [Tanacetum coccineum]